MLNVMLADDELYERDYLEKIIKESYQTLLKIVCKAVDGVEFMEKLDECNPQIILLDIKMPRMDGLETAKQIRKRYPDVEIIIVSAYSDFNYAKQAMKLGISEYLLKPYLDSDLRGALDRVIAKIREREDTLSMMSYSVNASQVKVFDFFKDLEKDLLWNLFFNRRTVAEVEKAFELRRINGGWLKVVVITSSTLSSMGDFSQEVLKNYFSMEGVIVLNSIWMSQMTICLFANQKDEFTELNSCIRRARNYLAKEYQICVACGVSGAYYGLEFLSEAYEEAASFIREYSEEDVSREFSSTTERMKQLCELEDEIIVSLTNNKRNESLRKFTELVEILETGLGYQDVAVKLNFGRSLVTIIHGINQIPEVRVKTAEAMKQLGKLEQLNFNGDNLKYHMDFFADMKVLKE